MGGASSLACLRTEPGRGCAAPATAAGSWLPLPQPPCAGLPRATHLPPHPAGSPGFRAGPPSPVLAAARAGKQRKAVGAVLTMVPMLYVAAGPMVWWYGSAAAYTLP